MYSEKKNDELQSITQIYRVAYMHYMKVILKV